MVEGSRLKWSEVEVLKSNVESSRVKMNHGRVMYRVK